MSWTLNALEYPEYIVSWMHLGMSEYVVSCMRLGFSEYVVYWMRLGMSEYVVSWILNAPEYLRVVNVLDTECPWVS